MKVLLNCLPPASCEYPDIGISILKSYLNEYKYDCDIIYWNLIFERILQKHFGNDFSIDSALLPFFLSFCNNDSKKQYIENEFLIHFPFLSLLDNKSRKKKIYSAIENINKKILNVIDEKKLCFEYQIIGVSYKYAQWLPGYQILSVMKQINPKLKMVIGGIPARIEAVDFLSTFYDIFDYAIWGEAENSLLMLVKYLYNNSIRIKDIPSLVYCENNAIKTNTIKPNYVSLYIPNYDDYFIQKTRGKKNVKLPIESSRSCSWKKCTFCFLNNGYKFRIKSNEELISNIDILSKKYHINTFTFVDNDIVRGNTDTFNELLDSLIKYRELINPNLILFFAEINTKGFNKDLIEKMKKAGFRIIQIGFESISDSILRKINKQSAFVDHLLFIKFANKYNLSLSLSNIIYGIPNESLSDIFESIDNLHFLRFYFSNGFKYSLTKLSIRKSSKYYHGILQRKQLEQWKCELENILPENILKIKFSLFNNIISSVIPEWKMFNRMGEFYMSNKFSYNLSVNNNKYIYKEYFNEELISCYEFTDIEKEILSHCNNKIMNMMDMQFFLQKRYKNLTLKKIEIIINNLFTEKIIFWDKHNNNIFSIIDIDEHRTTNL